MAHPNIYARQKFVIGYIKRRGNPTNKERVRIAMKFNCSSSAMYSDVVFYYKPYGLNTYPSRKVKKEVAMRDKDICQYCGISDEDSKFLYCIDHVIPTIKGGVGKDYNLVLACHSCNLKKKGGKVWIPDNIETLKIINPQWAERIIKLAS